MITKSSWVLLVFLTIAVVMLAWVLVSPPAFLQGNTATTTPNTENTDTENENGGQTGPLTPDQLKARVVLSSPSSNATVDQNFTITGKAPGPWYFEASFPIEIRDPNNNIVATGFATAQGEWMTTSDVPFTGTINVPSYTGPATLILMRDNPSGLPEHAASVSFPIVIQ